MTKAQHYLNPNYDSESKYREAEHFYVKEYLLLSYILYRVKYMHFVLKVKFNFNITSFIAELGVYGYINT